MNQMMYGETEDAYFERVGVWRGYARVLAFMVLASVALALSGCVGLKDVFYPTPVGCAPKNAPEKPKTFSDNVLSKLDDYHYVLVISAERLELIDYAGKADAVIQQCK
jgi:hypothetical protein